ncbi:MAG: hypothetical protein KDN19_08150 [Verrucomicrobiae bacterium]|nr:hypothetical protein [Verrucomicrobiae bacterium]
MTLHPDHRRSPSTTILGTALAVAPAAVGCAVGLLLADRVKGRSRTGLASGLLALGALATLPLVIDSVTRTLDHPAFSRGRQRRLEQIRDSGAFRDFDDDEEEEEELLALSPVEDPDYFAARRS